MKNKTEKTYKLKKIQIDNNEISYYVKNNRSKYTMIFIHGYMSSSDFASKLFNLKQKFNMIVLNLPGSYLLSKPKQQLNLELFSDIVEKFINKYVKSKKIILLGHSLGGATISNLSHLEQVKKIVYISTIHPEMIKSKSWKNMHDYYHKNKNRQYFNKYLKEYPELKEVFNLKSSFASITKNYLLNLKYVKEQLKKQYEESLEKKPLFIIGKNDYVIETNYFVNFVNKTLKNDVIVLDNVYHSPLLEAPKVVNDLLNQMIEKNYRKVFKSKIIK